MLRRTTGQLVLVTEADLESYDLRSITREKRKVADAEVEYSIAGGQTKGVNLSRRLRRVSTARANRLASIEAQIRRLWREHAETILSTWGDGAILEPAELRKIASKPRDVRGETVRFISMALDPKFEGWPPEVVATAKYKGSSEGCSLHSFSRYPGCPGCTR